MSFHFASGFLCGEEACKFDEVPCVCFPFYLTDCSDGSMGESQRGETFVKYLPRGRPSAASFMY